MSKLVQICLLLALFNTNMTAQRISFEVVGNAAFMNDQSYQSVRDFESTSYQVLSDTTYLRTRGTARSVSEKTYTAKLGYALQGRVAISLTDRFSVRTGIGLNYSAFSLSSEFKEWEWLTSFVDTIARPTGGGFGGGISSCDVYDNSSFDIEGISRDLQHQIINLTIPVEIGFDIIPGKLRTHAGIFFQTPVFTSVKREAIALKSELVNGESRCRFEKVEYDNRSGDGFNNLQYGLSASVQYEFFKGIGIEIAVSKAMSSVFVDEVYQSTFVKSGVFKPFIFSAGLSYRFGVRPISEE